MNRDFYKILFDYFILLIAHIILAPLFLVLWFTIPLAIWLHDRGPVFYAQTRLGKDGKPIYRDDGKVLKGPNYKPPTLTDLI